MIQFVLGRIGRLAPLLTFWELQNISELRSFRNSSSDIRPVMLKLTWCRRLLPMSDAVSTERITNLLLDWSNGDRKALDHLLPLIYSELRRLAASRLKWERKDHTLQPTALVHEAYMRMVNQRDVNWKNRAQFFALASEIMRRILVNHARDRVAAKRGGHAQRVSLSVANQSVKKDSIDVVALDLALHKLALQDSRKSRVVELKFFGGLTTEEIAEILQVSHATVEREWTLSRAWLYREIAGGKSLIPE